MERLKNSAFDLDGTPESFVFYSTGQWLKGNEYSEQYTELAKQLDEKRSAFHLEVKENKIIFCCGLSVKADSGKEERVVFIQVYNDLPSENINLDIKALNKFYEEVKCEIETFGLEKQRLVGFWEDKGYNNIRDWVVNREALNYTIHKIYSGKKVSVHISELNSGLSFILKLITILKHKRPLIFDVSKYPSNSDISVSLINPNPDFEIGKYGKCQIINLLSMGNQSNLSDEESVKDETSNSERSQLLADYVSEKSEVEIFQTSSNNGYNLNYGIYNSTGQLLKGNEHFEQYTEMAKQLDAKRSAFYLEIKEDKIILGCSLSVKADSGREERVVFIQVHNNLPKQYEITNCDIQFLKDLYEWVKSEIETFNSNKYQLVGLWSEADYKNIRYWPIHNDVLKYAVNKINSGKNVSVKISELSGGFSFILKLITILGHTSSLIFDISQYPSSSDVSVSLINPNPDFNIEEVRNETSNLKTSNDLLDSVNLVVKEILDTPSNLSFYKYKDDLNDRQKVEVFEKLITKVSDTNGSINKVLTEIYHNIKSSECKKDIYEISLSRNIHIEGLVKDLVKSTYKEKNKDLFSLLLKYSGNESVWDNNKSSKYNPSKDIKKSLQDLEYSEKVYFVKYVASETISSSKSKVKTLLKPLIEDLVMQDRNDFISKLTEEEAENLDNIQGSNYLDSKKAKKKKNRSIKIKIVSYAIVLIMFIFISCFVINHFHLIESDGENNSSINNTENSFDSFKLTNSNDNKVANATNIPNNNGTLEEIKREIISLIT